MRLVEDEDRTLGVKDELQLSLLFFTYLLFSWIGDFIGSSLLGAFVAGMHGYISISIYPVNNTPLDGVNGGLSISNGG